MKTRDNEPLGAASGSLALTTTAQAVTRDFERDGGATEPALRVLAGDCRKALRELATESVQCCVTSPPYWGLRDYGHEDQIGMEATPEEYIGHLVNVFEEVRRVLRADGTLWLNLGDSYAQGEVRHRQGQDSENGRFRGKPDEEWSKGTAQTGRKLSHGLKPKDLVGAPWRVALALQAAGWWLRSEIIWHKPNPMPESVTDRPTKSHEHIFLLAKSERYYYDADAIKEKALQPFGEPRGTSQHKQGDLGQNHNGTLGTNAGSDTRNKRDVWTVASAPYPGSHFAVFPGALISPCILAGSRSGDVVLDPFGGSGTTGATALCLGRKAILIELNPDYAKLIEQRTTTTMGLAL